MSDWKQSRPTFRPSANAPAARNSPTYPKTTFGLFGTISAGGNRSTGDRLVPFCMFTDPPLARVGMNEREAERQGVVARVARLPMSAVLRAQATGEKKGLMKSLVGENDDRILGFTMIGAEAGEVMAAVQMTMLADISYSRLADTGLAHPTMAENVDPLFSNVPPRSARRAAAARVA